MRFIILLVQEQRSAVKRCWSSSTVSSGSFQQVFVCLFSCANFISMCLPVLMVTIWLLYFQASICLPDLKKKGENKVTWREEPCLLEKPDFPRNPRWTSIYVSLVVTGLLDHSDTQSHKRGWEIQCFSWAHCLPEQSQDYVRKEEKK